MIKSKTQDCQDCFKIKCRNCGWEPNSKELKLINKGTLTACPMCGNGK